VRRIAGVSRSVGFGLLIVIILFPFIGVFVYMVAASFQSPLDFMSPTLTVFFEPTLENYQRIFQENNVLQFAFNSTVIALGSTALAVVLGTPAAFAIVTARRARLGAFILLTRATPGISLLLPWFVIFAGLRWIDTYQALIIAHLIINLPLVVWMMTNFLAEIPREIVEAARVDGASYFATLLRVVVPNARGGLVAVSILSFILSWNNFMFSVVLAVDQTKTLPVAAFSYLSYGNVEWGAIMAVAVVMTVPVAFVAFVAQKQLIAGLSARTEV
jgi:multiple sugar transport system permease protein